MQGRALHPGGAAPRHPQPPPAARAAEKNKQSQTPKSKLACSNDFGVFHGINLLGMVAGALALIAFAGVAFTARSNLDAVQTAHTVFGVMLAAAYIAQDALVLIGNGHFIHLP